MRVIIEAILFDIAVGDDSTLEVMALAAVSLGIKGEPPRGLCFMKNMASSNDNFKAANPRERIYVFCDRYLQIR
jgi:hypothetical protein